MLGASLLRIAPTLPKPSCSKKYQNVLKLSALMCHNGSDLWCLIRVALPPPYFFIWPCSLSRQVTPICPTFILLCLSIWKRNDTQQYLFSFGEKGNPPPFVARWKVSHQPRETSQGERFGKAVGDKLNRGKCFCAAVTSSHGFPVQGDNSWPCSPLVSFLLRKHHLPDGAQGTPQLLFFPFHTEYQGDFSLLLRKQCHQRRTSSITWNKKGFSLSQQLNTFLAQVLLTPVRRWGSHTWGTLQIPLPN